MLLSATLRRIGSRSVSKGKVFYVSPNGKIPTCIGCRTAVDRGSTRLVKKEVVDQDKRWTSTVITFKNHASSLSILSSARIR